MNSPYRILVSCAFIALGVFGLWRLNINRTNRLHFSKGHTYVATENTNILFDLNDVLFTIDKKKALSLLGTKDVILYLLSGKKSADLENALFAVVESIRPSQPTAHDGNISDLQALHNGKPLPPLMQEWMLGTMTGQELIDVIKPHLDYLGTQDFFVSPREERLIKKAVCLLFDPQTRCDLYRPIKRGVNLVKRCKQYGHKVYLISNMDSELITLLQAKHPAIFDLFDGMIISADIQAMKPHKDIYEHALFTYKLDPARSYLIDDQLENIHGAQQSGMHGIQCNYRHYKKRNKAIT